MKNNGDKAVLSTLLSDISRGKLSLEHPIQRKQDQFSKLQKSLLIDSCLRDYPIPPLFIYEQGKKKFVIDGKQRLSTFLQFINNEFELSKNMPKITFSVMEDENKEEIEKEFDISGLRYEDLPREMKEHIKETNLYVYTITNCSDEELSDVFLRLNNGSPLNTSQKLKATTSFDTKKRIYDIINTPFFEEVVNLQKGQINKSDDETIVLQIIMLSKGLFNFTNKGMMEFTQSYTFDESDFDVLDKAVDELYNAFEQQKVKNLRKLSIPMVVAVYISCENEESKAKYVAALKEFFDEENFKNNTTYKELCKSGTAQSTNVKLRYDVFANMK